MKKLLFDGLATQGIRNFKFHGGSDYAKFMLREMIRRGYRFDVVLSTERFTDPEIEELLKELKGKVYNVGSIAELYRLIDSEGYDNFYSALPYDYSAYRCKAQFIGVIHGIRKQELPCDRFSYKYEKKWHKRLAWKIISGSDKLREKVRSRNLEQMRKVLEIPGARFITVSRHSKYSLLNFYPALGSRDIKVFYSPFSPGESRAERPGDYWLMVNGDRPVKNLYRTIKVFDSLFSQGFLSGKRLVVTGADHVPFIGEVVNKERFEFLPYVDNDTLANLYRNAYALFYPSLNEGFGYPPLIAMSYGVPVAASASTSIPEACGDAALYFCPTDLYDMRNRILQLEYDEEAGKTLVEKGEKRLQEVLKKQEDSMEEYIDYIFS